ncbi:MAG: hypothetical protein OCD76_06835 [Reichenbachiella sp.]
MKLFTKQAERTFWIALVASIPFTILSVQTVTGTIGTLEIAITASTLFIGILIMYLVKWYANKD